MSTSIFILGQSGSGKSTSLRNLNPRRVLLIQSIRKPLPFRSADWKYITAEDPNGSILVSDNPQEIIHHIRMTRRPIVIIDDFQYVMANEFMRRSTERGFDKFTEIGFNAWSIITEALPKSLGALMANPITVRKPKNNNGGFQQNQNNGFGSGYGQNGGFDQGGYNNDVPPVLDAPSYLDDIPY